MASVQSAVTVKKKIQRLQLRIETLETIFKERSDDEEERTRRDEILRYAIIFHRWTRA